MAQPLFDLLDFRGIKRTWLAGRIGVSKQYLSAVEAGVEQLTPERRRQIADLLQTPESMLFRDPATKESA